MGLNSEGKTPQKNATQHGAPEVLPGTASQRYGVTWRARASGGRTQWAFSRAAVQFDRLSTIAMLAARRRHQRRGVRCTVAAAPHSRAGCVVWATNRDRAMFANAAANSYWAHGVVVSHPLRMRKALGSNPSVSILLHRLAFLKSINADHAGSMAQECFPCHDWHAQQLKERTMDTLGIEPRASRMLSGCDTTTPCAQLTGASQEMLKV